MQVMGVIAGAQRPCMVHGLLTGHSQECSLCPSEHNPRLRICHSTQVLINTDPSIHADMDQQLLNPTG